VRRRTQAPPPLPEGCCLTGLRRRRRRMARVRADRTQQFPGANQLNSHYRGAPRRTRLTMTRRMTAPRNDTSKLGPLKLL
jgi:hypothetical protein